MLRTRASFAAAYCWSKTRRIRTRCCLDSRASQSTAAARARESLLCLLLAWFAFIIARVRRKRRRRRRRWASQLPAARSSSARIAAAMLDETTLEKRAEQIGEVWECMIGPQHLKMLTEIKTLVFWHDKWRRGSARFRPAAAVERSAAQNSSWRWRRLSQSSARRSHIEAKTSVVAIVALSWRERRAFWRFLLRLLAAFEPKIGLLKACKQRKRINAAQFDLGLDLQIVSLHSSRSKVSTKTASARFSIGWSADRNQQRQSCFLRQTNWQKAYAPRTRARSPKTFEEKSSQAAVSLRRRARVQVSRHRCRRRHFYWLKNCV